MYFFCRYLNTYFTAEKDHFFFILFINQSQQQSCNVLYWNANVVNKALKMCQMELHSIWEDCTTWSVWSIPEIHLLYVNITSPEKGKRNRLYQIVQKNSEEYLLEVKTLIWTDLSKGIKTKKLTLKFLCAGPVANNNRTHDGDQRIKWGSLFASLLALRVESPGSWQTLVSL